MHGVATFTRHVHRLVSDKRASVAILFALSLVPLITFVGAAVDYSRAANAKERLTAIADAVVLEAMSAALLPTLWKLPDGGKAQAENHFVTQARSIPDLSLDPPKVVITQTSNMRTVSLEYSATIRNVFGSFLIPSTPLGGQVVSSKSLLYMDFYLILDNSPSMGLAATPADITKMQEATKDYPRVDWQRCAFACHVATIANDHYKIARDNNITLRIDVVREATKRLIDRASATEIVNDQFRVGIYTLNMALQEISPLTANLAYAKSAADNVQLMTMPYDGFNNYRLTNFSGLLPYIDYIPAGGNGMSSSSPQTVMFLVSDGVADEATTPRTKPIPKELCDKIKAKNIKIAALYTTYLPMPANYAYQTEVAPIADKIAPAMQACASPDLYFEVSPSQGISEAMQALFAKAVGQARLTQ